MQAKPAQIHIKCHPDEKDAIQERADRLGKGVTAYLLDLAADDAGFQRVARAEGNPAFRTGRDHYSDNPH